METDVKEEEFDLSDRIVLEEEKLLNTYGTDFVKEEICGPGEKWDVSEYCKTIQVDVTRMNNDGYEMEFDLVNTEPAIANALRRILLAEVPTMAIDQVYLYQNTSLIPDEMLCHRLGLVPIKVDPGIFEDSKPQSSDSSQDGAQGDKHSEPVEPLDPNPMQTLIFELKVKCTKNALAAKGSTDPSDLYVNAEVYSKQLRWIPIGKQEDIFAKSPPAPVHSDILIAKLRPGQEIELKCHCSRGIGRDHAKFSPVATASYRLLPEIILKQRICGERAERFKSCFSDGVIKLSDDPETGEKVASVKNARKDLCSRNVFRHPDLADAVVLTRRRRHFIFSVESVGALKAADLTVEACGVMQRKCRDLLKLLDENS